MDVVVKGRHCEVTERFRQHAAEKLGKIGKFDQKVLRIDVELCKERNPRLTGVSERVELTVRSRGPVVRAEAAAQDFYSALDLACTKLEARLRRVADRRRVHHAQRNQVAVSNGSGSAAPAPAAAVADESLAEFDGDERILAEAGPFVVREKVHDAVPMELDQALFEMELVGHDFFLFVDAATGEPAVVYRRRGYDYGVIRLRTG